MSTVNYICIIITICAVLLSLFVVLYNHIKARKTLQTMNDMLEAVINGDFTENKYDESMLSAVEAKLARYLSSSMVSAKNLSEEKDKIKELIADISHQTKTPVANILLYAQLLSEQNLPEESKLCVQALIGQSKKLSFLISSLVKVSRLEAGVFILNPVTNDVKPMLENVVLQIEPKAKAKQIIITLESTMDQAKKSLDSTSITERKGLNKSDETDKTVKACFDSKWTTEALQNIVDNAVKYTPKGGQIRIKVLEYELFVRIDISDTGIGISEEEQTRIFGRFYRSQAVSEMEGVGIGLYLARQIVSEEGGYIKVVSRLGEGTTFSVFLPTRSENDDMT